MANIECYRDSYSDSWEYRSRIAKEQFSRLAGYMPKSYEVERILEIGPGSGGVSTVLNSIYPGAEIWGVDVDPRSVVSLQRGITRFMIVNFLDNPDLARSVDLIVAMRANPDVVVILDDLVRTGLKSTVLFSLIGEVVEDSILISKYRTDDMTLMIPLIEMRGLNEYGFIWNGRGE